MADNDEDGAADTTPSREEIAAIFLRKAPPGELLEVYQDVRALLNEDDDVLQRIARQAFIEHHKEHFLCVEVEGAEKPAHITPFNQLPDGHFYHPRNKSSFRFDPIRGQASDWSDRSAIDIASLEHLEPKRLALEAAVDDYVVDHFKCGSANVYCTQRTDDARHDFVACIVSTQYQKNNFWSGHWKSQWTVTLQSDTTAVVTGRIDVRVHYFENGNVQLQNCRHPVERQISFTNDSSFGQSVAKLIGDEESACQQNLDDSCKSMSDSTFRGLRRQLPITRSKIDWSKINYKVSAELKPF